MEFALQDYFSAQVFFIILRETLESAIIVSVLLAFLKQSLVDHHGKKRDYEAIARDSTEVGEGAQVVGSGSSSTDPDVITKDTNLIVFNKLKLQVWLGSIAGLLCCSVIGGSFIFMFYFFETDVWSKTEHYWEGALSIFASIIIPIMGLAMLRVNKLQEKWKVKLTNLMLAKNLASNDAEGNKQTRRSKFITFSEKYAMFFLPFVTILREGLEAVIFVAGIGVNSPSSSIPLSFILGIIFGVLVGVVLYKTGDSLSLKIFLVASTCFLYIVAAGLFSKGVWQFELQRYIDLCNGQDMSEVGSGPGSYDISHSIWHVNCCNAEIDGGWMLFGAIFGWTNSATYASVTAYIFYWAVIICVVRGLQYEEQNGVLPLIPLSWQKKRIAKRIKFQHLSQRAASAAFNIHDIVSVDSATPLAP